MRAGHAARLVGVEGLGEAVDAALHRRRGRQFLPVEDQRLLQADRLRAAGEDRAAKRSTAASSRSGGATASTSPQASASAASIVSPVSSSRRARPWPISCGNSAASTTEGMPILTSGMPNIDAVAGDAQIAGGGELQPGAERVAVDPGDDRHRQAAERVAAAMHQRDEVARAVAVERRDLVDIGAADKGALAGAGQDHEPQLRVRGEPPAASTISPISARLRLLSLAALSIVSRAQMAAFGPLLAITTLIAASRASSRLEVARPGSCIRRPRA